MAVRTDAQALGTTARLSRCHDQASSAQVKSRIVQAKAVGFRIRASQPTLK